MAKVTTKDAVIALLESQIYDLKTEASPVSDFYLSRNGTYRFDVTDDEIERYRRRRISYRVSPCVSKM